MTHLEHKLLVITARVERPPKDPLYIEQSWLPRLIAGIGMEKLLEPQSVYFDEMPGNVGLTATCIIKTSHIALHTWDEEDPARVELQIFTCGPIEPEWVLPFLEEFGLVRAVHLFVDLGNGIDILDKGTLEAREEIA